MYSCVSGVRGICILQTRADMQKNRSSAGRLEDTRIKASVGCDVNVNACVCV